MKRFTLPLTFCLFLLVGAPRLFTLSAHCSSDEMRWLGRSAEFMNAMREGQFEQTLIAYHPGVTTLWLCGIRAFFLGNTAVWGSLRDLAFARWFICIAVSTGVVATFFLLHRLLGTWQLATAAWGMVAVNPFLLAQTRRAHTDALATTFIFFTVLLFLLFCITPPETQRRQRYRYLFFAGVAFGFACLSKSYSLILLPGMPLCLWIFRDKDIPWREFIFNTFLTGIFFFNWSLLTVFTVWPLFWHPRALLLGGGLLGTTLLLQCSIQTGRHVRTAIGAATLLLTVCAGYAIKTFWLVLDKVGWALTKPHEIDHFFLGKVVADPGGLFYLFTLSLKSTPFVLPLAIGAFVFLWKHRQEKDTSKHFKCAIAIGAVVILFTVCLSLTSKKFPRYLLPAFPLLDVLAGIGIIYTLKWVGAGVKKRHIRKIVQGTCVGLVLLLTAVPIFALHPYYGTYYNPCWKVTDITNIITTGDTSGLELAAKYLNKKPNAQLLSVQASVLGAEFLRYYFLGNVYRSDQNRNEDTDTLRPTDYEIVYIRDSQIGRVPQRGTRNGTLERTITLNGIDHVWIYRIQNEETP